MSDTLAERIAKSKARTAILEQQRRVEQRQEREAKKKKDQRRNYVIGELVTKYFPEVLRFEPGTKAENAVTFEPLEAFLSSLCADLELIKQLSEKANMSVSKIKK